MTEPAYTLESDRGLRRGAPRWGRPLSIDPLVEPREHEMPTRRIFELALAVAILTPVAMGLVRLWAAKTLGSQPEGSIARDVAEVVTILN